MSRFGGLSEERPSVFKTRSKLGTHLSTQCSGDERQSRPCAARTIPISYEHNVRTSLLLFVKNSQEVRVSSGYSTNQTEGLQDNSKDSPDVKGKAKTLVKEE
ncbi:hypothetical protein TNCV_2911581 [Trichonephila clavipes]|nr:hypothetical protein TNCV_2911581 [Trichonephila clavipes]